MNPKQFDNFYHRNVYTHATQKNTLGTSTVQPKNQGAREIWVSLHSIQEIHETHGKTIGTIYGKISEHVPIKIWDIKWTHPSGNNLGVSQNLLQQDKNHVWILCTSSHRHHQQHKEKKSGSNWTALRKRMGWILLHVTCYWETTPFVHMEIVTNQQTSNTKGRRPDHEGKIAINDQEVPNFVIEPHNYNNRQIRQRTHTC